MNKNPNDEIIGMIHNEDSTFGGLCYRFYFFRYVLHWGRKIYMKSEMNMKS